MGTQVCKAMQATTIIWLERVRRASSLQSLIWQRHKMPTPNSGSLVQREIPTQEQMKRGLWKGEEESRGPWQRVRNGIQIQSRRPVGTQLVGQRRMS